MEKVVHKFKSWAEADAADDRFYANLTPEERLRLFVELIGTDHPDEEFIERSARVYPLAQSPEG